MDLDREHKTFLLNWRWDYRALVMMEKKSLKDLPIRIFPEGSRSSTSMAAIYGI